MQPLLRLRPTRISGVVIVCAVVTISRPAVAGDAGQSEPPPISFRGIQAGASRVSDLLNHKTWGAPVNREQDHSGLTFLEYRVRGYRRVVICARGDAVRSIDVWLPEGVSSRQAASHFSLGREADTQEPMPGALVGTALTKPWLMRLFDAAKVALFVEESGAYPVVGLMRFYSDIDSQAQAAYQRGAREAASGAEDKALDCFAEAVRLEPHFVAAHKERGDIRVRQGNLPGARDEYEKALRIYPAYAQVYVHLGNVCHHEKKYEAALEQYEKAVGLSPTNADAFNSMAWLRATCPVSRFRDGAAAVKHARRACELTKWKVFYCLDTLAAAYAEQGNFGEAQETVKKAISAAPEKQQPLLRQQLQLYERGQAYRER